MKYLLLASLVLLSACSRQTEESNRFVLPSELKHCTMYQMVDNLTIVYVDNVIGWLLVPDFSYPRNGNTYRFILN